VSTSDSSSRSFWSMVSSGEENVKTVFNGETVRRRKDFTAREFSKKGVV
jgi:hypothetical protein